MRLTTKGRFAVTAMIDLAKTQHEGPVSIQGISERQDISIAYLEQLFSKLRRSALVKSVRGPGGGYLLAKKPEDVSVADIVFAVDEPLDVTRCGGHGNCAKGSITCITHDLWANLNEKIVDYLASVSLAALASSVVEHGAKQDSNIIFIKQENRHNTRTNLA